jgi:hypothetical protein
MAMELIAGRKSFNIGYSPDMARQFLRHTSVVIGREAALQRCKEMLHF